MEVGCVYIITTQLYEPLDIYKIGCTKDINRRLKTMNASRASFDKFFIVNQIQTFHYFKLEQGLHKLLQKYRLNNEFFQCNVDIIENAISNYANTNVFMLHDDKIAHVAIEKKLKWFQKNNLFSITDNNLEIFLNESSLINEIKQWLSVFDKHNLYKFLHPSHFYSIISYLKTVCIQNDEENLINEMNMLSIKDDSKNSSDSEDLSKQIHNLKLD